MLESYIENKIIKEIDKIHIVHTNDKEVSNFGKQWKQYRDVQVDSKNNFKLSYNFLNELCYYDLSIIKNKNILEIGCGSGRFTEYLSKYGKNCFSIDLSDAIFHNVCKHKDNVVLIKADFLNLKLKKKFDVVFCRGVLQHTEFPTKSILKLHDYVNENGIVIFDFYKKPKLGFFHPKYLIWRPFIKKFVKYETYEKFLNNNISLLLSIKRKIDLIFFKKKFFSDAIIPVWDYYDDLGLTNNQYMKLALLDTMDGLYANYDKPYSYKMIKDILIKNNKIILQSNKKNYFISKNNFS